MPSDPKLDLLRSIPLFERLRKSDLQRLGQLADEVDVGADRVLMRQGDYGREMFVIISGHVRVERDGSHIRELGPGSWVGEMALLSEGLRTATVTTTEPSRLFVVGHREFHALMAEVPSVRMAVYESLAQRIRGMEQSTAH
jgi:CRP-like cAMP-binding protein